LDKKAEAVYSTVLVDDDIFFEKIVTGNVFKIYIRVNIPVDYCRCRRACFDSGICCLDRPKKDLVIFILKRD
jgi:hypothetical protein